MHVHKLSPRVWSYTPEAPTPGQLVIICSWTDARPQHIARYIKLHNQITPGARILLVQSSASMLVSPYAWQQAALKPAVQYIIDNVLLSPIDERTSNPEHITHHLTAIRRNDTNILLHSFSNGGGLTATQLLFLLRETTHAPLPLVGIVMDSSPDGGDYSQSHNAMVVAQPSSKPRRAVVSMIAHAALLPVWACYIIGQQENSQLVMRRTFLDPEYVDTTSIYYVYSKDDKITNWRDVRIHAEEARAKGWFVDENVLEGSSHCAHIRSQGHLYAALVERAWNGVRRQSRL
jgi:Eukaryotic protein of unknown function (DUF829)